MTERAKKLPLTLYVDTRKAWPTFLEMRNDCSVKYLHLEYFHSTFDEDYNHIAKTLSQYFAAEFPHLLHIGIRNKAMSGPHALDLGEFIAPDLDSMYLLDVYLCRFNPSCSNITALHLIYYRRSPPNGPCLAILDVLALTPRLVSWKCIKAMCNGGLKARALDSPRCVTLPCLTVLSLQGDGNEELDSLLRHLRTPAVIDIRFTGSLTPGHTDAVSADLHPQVVA